MSALPACALSDLDSKKYSSCGQVCQRQHLVGPTCAGAICNGLACLTLAGAFATLAATDIAVENHMDLPDPLTQVSLYTFGQARAPLSTVSPG